MCSFSIKKVFLSVLAIVVSFSLTAKNGAAPKSMDVESNFILEDGPGGKKKKNKYNKTSAMSPNLRKRVRSSRGRSSSMSIAGNGSNNRLSGGKFRMRGTGTKVKSRRKPNNKVKRRNKYKFNWIRKSRKDRSTNYRHDRTGDRSNSFKY